jgi:hypothetical protein
VRENLFTASCIAQQAWNSVAGLKALLAARREVWMRMSFPHCQTHVNYAGVTCYDTTNSFMQAMLPAA